MIVGFMYSVHITVEYYGIVTGRASEGERICAIVLVLGLVKCCD